MSVDENLILIVDDEPDFRGLLSQYLQIKGLKSLEAENVEVAIELIQKHKFSLILSDMQMPKGGGLVLLKYILDQSPHKAPVIFITGHAFGKDDEAHALGAFAILSKPFDMPDFFNMVFKALSKAA